MKVHTLSHPAQGQAGQSDLMLDESLPDLLWVPNLPRLGETSVCPLGLLVQLHQAGLVAQRICVPGGPVTSFANLKISSCTVSTCPLAPFAMWLRLRSLSIAWRQWQLDELLYPGGLVSRAPLSQIHSKGRQRGRPTEPHPYSRDFPITGVMPRRWRCCAYHEQER